MMGKRFSFTKYEQELVPDFRRKINEAESTEDVRKFFARTVQELFSKAFEGKRALRYDDIRLDPRKEPFFVLNKEIIGSADVKSVLDNSDLLNVLQRLAQSAARRYKHLEKKPEKTEAKIRM